MSNLPKRDTQYIMCRSRQNGGRYRIGISLYRQYPEDWEVIPEDVPGLEEVKKDADRHVDVEDYFALKTALIDLGIEFKVMQRSQFFRNYI